MQAMEWVAAVTDDASRTRLLNAARTTTTIVAASALEAKGERDLLYRRAFEHPRDARIRFVEDSHSYFVDGVRVGISVSGFYAAYFGHFDAEAVVAKNIRIWRTLPTSKYHAFLEAMEGSGVDRAAQAAAIRYCWGLNGDTQSALGTALHRVIELAINEEGPPPAEPEPAPPEVPERAAGVVPFLKSPLFNLEGRAVALAAAAIFAAGGPPEGPPPRSTFPPRTDVAEYHQFVAWEEDHAYLIPVRQEMNVFSAEHDLAGQLDALYWDVLAREFVLVDWKRVRNMVTEPDTYAKYGRPPFNKVLDSNYGHYSVRLTFIMSRVFDVGVKLL